MKVETMISVAVVLLGLGFVSQSAFADTISAAKKKAEVAMMSACKKEFPDDVAGKKVDDVDHWAEANENGTNSAEFKKSKCYSIHEKWEKLAQRNEWAPEARMPASAPSSK